jgi:hypothetical protein
MYVHHHHICVICVFLFFVYRPSTDSITSLVPKHIPMPEILPDGALLYELIMFLYTATACALQFLHLYRSVWWLPTSYSSTAMVMIIILFYFNTDLCQNHKTVVSMANFQPCDYYVLCSVFTVKPQYNKLQNNINLAKFYSPFSHLNKC